MDALKMKRMPLRSTFNKTFSSLNEILSDSSPDVNILELLLYQLIDKGTRLSVIDD